MAAIRVIGWEGVESFEISECMAEAIGVEPHFIIEPENGYFYCEVRAGSRLRASSTFGSDKFPQNLPEADKPRFIFLWLFPSNARFTPS